MKAAFRVVTGDGARALPPVAGLSRVFERPQVIVEVGDSVRSMQRSAQDRLFVIGRLLGRRAGTSLVAADPMLLDLWADVERADLSAWEGEFVVIRIGDDGHMGVIGDALMRRDVYWSTAGAGAWVASRLDLAPNAAADEATDSIALAHALCIYGSRPAKQQTLQRGVSRLGLGQSLRWDGRTWTVASEPFRPTAIGQYQDDALHRYADLFLDAVAARSTDANVVYLSSGWDSTAILAALVHVRGPKAVRCVIGRMIYSDRRGIINQFEIDRARAVAEFFGVPLEVTDFDYRGDCGPLVERASSIFAAHDLASVTGLNHLLLGEHVARTARTPETVFAGELSDGAHNLGFSQYATIFHHTLAFREYSDKMATYLFGPTFFRRFLGGDAERDEVYGFLRGRAVGDYDALGLPEERSLQFLSSFFLRSRRFPLWSLSNSRLLSEAGRTAYLSAMEERYLRPVAEQLTPETVYSCILQLYPSFHWQGSTVATLPATVEAQGLDPALPFGDGRLHEFFAGMPEDWGRGLEMRPTKYPLKWMLANRIRYPMHLQVGPHSYLYDVDPTFSHTAELLYASGLRRIWSDRLGEATIHRLEEAGLFDVDYARRLVGQYTRGDEVRGGEMSDTLMLALSATFTAQVAAVRS